MFENVRREHIVQRIDCKRELVTSSHDVNGQSLARKPTLLFLKDRLHVVGEVNVLTSRNIKRVVGGAADFNALKPIKDLMSKPAFRIR